MNYRVLRNRINGRLTTDTTLCRAFSYEDAKPQLGSNHWSSTENNRNNARNVNFNNGNSNNNNKYNGLTSRPVAAFQGSAPSAFTASVWEAYYDCLRGKRTSPQAVEYMPRALDDIPRLADEMWTGTYRPGTSTCFLVRYPKWREVFAAAFRDRIVHHWICLRLEPFFEERFERQGNVSFNCRKGFGTEAAVKHVADGMKRVSGNYRKEAWVFRGDLVGFFMSIDKELLWRMLERFIWRSRKRAEFGCVRHAIYEGEMYWDVLARLTKVVVMHHPENDCVLNSPPSWWRHLAPNKSLFTSPTGEPIGNLTTQLFANFLMSHFTTYVQWLYRGKDYCYAQFVDDFVLTCSDKRHLIDSIPKIDAFLRSRLHLELHKDKRYFQPVAHGVKFVGTFIKPGRMYLSNRVRGRMEMRFKGIGKSLSQDSYLIDLHGIEATVNSYLGFCQRRSGYRWRRACVDSIGDVLYDYFNVRGHYDNIQLKAKFK